MPPKVYSQPSKLYLAIAPNFSFCIQEIWILRSLWWLSEAWEHYRGRTWKTRFEKFRIFWFWRFDK